VNPRKGGTPDRAGRSYGSEGGMKTKRGVFPVSIEAGEACSGNTTRTTSRGERSKSRRQTNASLPVWVQTLKIPKTP